MRSEREPSRYARVPLGRRSAAFAIDFVVVGILSSTLGTTGFAQSTLFVMGWLAMRVVLVLKNHGQSLGRWAFNMKVLDPRRRSIPSLQALAIREGTIAIAAALALSGIATLNPASPWSILLLIPLIADGSLAFLDRDNRQAIHDQLAKTVVVQTQRGYSLDIKIKKLVANAQLRMKK